METYTKKQIVELIPTLTPRQVQFYTDEGVITPLETKSGRGNVRRYTKENLYEFAVVGYLAKIGITVSTIRNIIELKPFAFIFGGKTPPSTTGEFTRYNREDFLNGLSQELIIFFQNGEVVLFSIQRFEGSSMSPLAIKRYCVLDDGSKIKYDALIYLDLAEILKGLPR